MNREHKSQEGFVLEEKAAKLLPILVNAPGFEKSKEQNENEEADSNDAESENKKQQEAPEFRRIVLQNVVRRLYQVTRNIDKNGKPIEKSNHQGEVGTYNNSSDKDSTRRIGVDRSGSDDHEALSESVGISELFTKAVATEVRKIINLEELEKKTKLVENELKVNFSIEKLLQFGASYVALLP